MNSVATCVISQPRNAATKHLMAQANGTVLQKKEKKNLATPFLSTQNELLMLFWDSRPDLLSNRPFNDG
jgi:hypothetical protein